MRRVGEYPLWIGTARDARDLRAVLDAGIASIVDLAMDEPSVQPTRELVYLRFPLIDGSGNPAWMLRTAVTALVELVQASEPTLVACGAGMSRSPCIVAATIAAIEQRPMASVLAMMSGPIDVSPELMRELIAALEPR